MKKTPKKGEHMMSGGMMMSDSEMKKMMKKKMKSPMKVETKWGSMSK